MAFSHVTACALAEPSKTVLWHRSASIHVVSGRALPRAPLCGGFQPCPFGCKVGSQFRLRSRFQPPPLKFRTSGFPTVRLQAAGTVQFESEPSARPPGLRLIPPCPRSAPAFAPPFDDPRLALGKCRPSVRLPARVIATCAQRSSLRPGCVVPHILACRPHPPVRRTPRPFPAIRRL